MNSKIYLEFQNILNQQINLKFRRESNLDIDNAVGQVIKLISSCSYIQSGAWSAIKPGEAHYPNFNYPIVAEKIQRRLLIVEKRRARAKY